MSVVGSTEPPESGGAGFAGAGADVSQPREVLVLVHRGGEFLVLRRSPQYDGYWHPVAGGVEVGETETQAAAREVLEELVSRRTYALSTSTTRIRSARSRGGSRSTGQGSKRSRSSASRSKSKRRGSRR